MSLSINSRTYSAFHFVGIFGSGMSALAQFLKRQGCSVSGSDRLTGSDDVERTRQGLAALGCILLPQDGSGVSATTGAVVVSTAIEETNEDIRAARAHGVPVFHRSEALAAIIDTYRTIAIAGTSGKSTVSAMVFELLRKCGRDPSLIGGANLLSLTDEGHIGNAWRGSSDLLVVEADESDGSLVRYRPEISVVLNVSRDHKPVDEVIGLFAQLAEHSRMTICNADDVALSPIRAQLSFGWSADANFRFDKVDEHARGTTAWRDGRRFELHLPGHHNAANLLAALCVCDHLGCDGERLAAAVSAYRGIARRFAVTETRRGITVVDDFAHNPEKVRAALTAARSLSRRIVAVFQPHGFGPTRFLKDDFIKVFPEVLTRGDTLILQPIYYAGGTAQRDISSEELAAEIRKSGVEVLTPQDRAATLALIAQTAREGDCVISMGARDPSLDGFAREIMRAVDEAPVR